MAAHIIGPELALEGIEPAAPLFARPAEPAVHFVERRPIQGLDARLAFGPADDQTSGSEDIQMLGNGRRAHVEFLDQVSGCPIADGEQLNDASAGRIGEGGKAVHPSIIKNKLN